MLFRVLYYEEGMCKYTNLKKTKVYIKLEVFIHSVVYSLLSMFDSTKFHSVCYKLTKLGTVVALRVYIFVTARRAPRFVGGAFSMPWFTFIGGI